METAFRPLRRASAGGAVRQRPGAGGRPRRRRRARCGSTRGCMAFARYWGFRPRACAPYRARTKGKDERGVGYVKRNAIAGHGFDSWAALEAHLTRWMREVADVRVSTARRARRRWRGSLREEAAGAASARRPSAVRPGARADAAGEVGMHDRGGHQRYSVPWRLIGETVAVRWPAGGSASAMRRARSPSMPRSPAAGSG